MKDRAYAKINLCLDVVRRRPDGYHDVRMIMQTIVYFIARKNTEKINDALEIFLKEHKGNEQEYEDHRCFGQHEKRVEN